jgi:ribosome-associated protein
MEKINITTENIKLDQLLKYAAIIASGGQTKLLIEQKMIMVNNVIVTEKRKKIYPGDIITIKDTGVWQVVRE